MKDFRSCALLCVASLLLATRCNGEEGEAENGGGGGNAMIFPQTPVEKTYVFHQDLFASDTGYYEVEGYGREPSPELQMQQDKTYRFDQLDASNWYHPLGFAYLPDGAHGCLEEGGCPEVETDGLKYFIDGEEVDLDTYEPAFEIPREEWLQHTHWVELTVRPSDPNFNKGEIFYFCHLHRGMSGRIQLLDAAGNVIEGERTPLYKPYRPDPFDAMCGTYEVSQYAPGQGYDKQCGDLSFICGDVDNDFGKCMRAIDCKMNREMRVVNSDNPVVTFMHQMIPHHDNAVNMAKIILKLEADAGGEKGRLEEGAYNIVDEDTWDLLYNIVNTQNEQITFMNTWLEENGYEPFDRRPGGSSEPGHTKLALCPPGPATAASARRLG